MEKNKKFPFKIGADPEFNFIIQNTRVSAVNLVQSLFKKNKNYKSTSEGYEIGTFGNLGWDGCSSTAEIRPNPSNLAVKVVENLGGMFKALADNTQLFELSTLSEKAPVGGHIHLQLPEDLVNKTNKLQSIHKQLCSFYVPLLLGEDALNLRTRRKSNYGDITDFRVQAVKEGVHTFEFRVPSAEWLTTPRVAVATLAYLGTVYNEILNHPENMKIVKEILITSNAQAEALQALSMSSFVFLTEALNKKIKKHIKTFEFYDAYKNEIDYILNSAKVYKDKKAVGFDILKGWNLQKKAVFSKRDFLSPKKVTDLSKVLNLDDFRQVVEILYNDDDFVSVFVRALQQRIIAHNWKTKNKYFLYGMRKGISELIAIDKNRMAVAGGELIKTQRDNETMKNVFYKMNERFYVDNSGNTSPKSNAEASQYIIIGIPYDMRYKQDTKEFLKLIYDIEKGPKKNRMPAFEDEGKPIRGDSEIDRAYYPSNYQIEELSIITAETTIAMTNARQAEIEIAQEAF